MGKKKVDFEVLCCDRCGMTILEKGLTQTPEGIFCSKCLEEKQVLERKGNERSIGRKRDYEFYHVLLQEGCRSLRFHLAHDGHPEIIAYLCGRITILGLLLTRQADLDMYILGHSKEGKEHTERALVALGLKGE